MEIQGLTTNYSVSQPQSGRTTQKEEIFDKLGYLKLLIAQLRHQDPLNPLSNNEFMSQMTQFAMLEQLQNMTSAFSSSSRTNMITGAALLVGKEVILRPTPNEVVVGEVQQIRCINDKIELLVNAQWYSIDSVAGISKFED